MVIRVRRLSLLTRLRLFRLAPQESKCVATAEPKGVYAREPERWLPVVREGRKWFYLCRNLQPPALEIDGRIGVFEMQVGWRRSVLQAQGALDDSCDAGPGLKMPDVGLDRADEEFLARIPAASEHLSQRGGFDRVADRGAGPVRFDIDDVLGRHSRLLARASQQGYLRLAARQC